MIMYDHVRPSSKIFKVQSEPSQLDLGKLDVPKEPLEPLGATRFGHQGDRGVGHPRLGVARGRFRAY